MAKGLTEQVITAKLPASLFDALNQVAKRTGRAKSWIIKQALSEWLTEEERRYRLTLEGLEDVRQGRVLSQEEVEAHFVKRRSERRSA